MADIQQSSTIWNWILSSWNQNNYTSIVNFDIVWPSYSWFWQKKRPTSFYLWKRDAYYPALSSPYETVYANRDITDYKKIQVWWCNWEGFEEYLLLKDRNNNNVKVLMRPSWECVTWYDRCWNDAYSSTACDDCWCQCQYDRFFVTDFVKWKPVSLWVAPYNTYHSQSWVQENIADWTVGIFYDESAQYFANVQIWDWLYVDSSNNNTWSAVCWQSRQVVSIDYSTTDRLYDILYLNAPRIWLDNNKWINAWYAIYPDWWQIISYATCDWLKAIHSIYDWDWNINPQERLVCSGFSDACIVSIAEYWNAIYMLWNKWYQIYWWLWQDKFNFSSSNLVYVWEDKVSMTVWRSFLISFSKNNIAVTARDTSGNSFWYKLDAGIWLFSSNSFEVFMNSLYIIANDWLLYSVDITSNWLWWYNLSLTDQSQQIYGELNLLQHWDNVSLSQDWKHLYIFINNKTHRDNNNNTKTRILKYNKQYSRWVTHDICDSVISRVSEWLFLWDNAYVMLWNKDWWVNYVNAYVEFIIGESENWSEIPTLMDKELSWIKMTLGRWIYTNWNTKVVIDYNSHWYKHQFQVNTIEHIDWVQNNNILAQWNELTPDACVLEWLRECTNVVRPCEWMPIANAEIKPWLLCRPIAQTYMDNCACLDDKWYALSDVYNVFISTEWLNPSNIYKVKVISEWGDRMVFWGIAAWVFTSNIGKHDIDWTDSMTSWDTCCVEWRFINENNPFGCN